MKVDQTYTIQVPVAKVWQALTDVTVIEHWTMGEARMDVRPGGEFSFSEGDIYGTNSQIEPLKLLRQAWHKHGTPEWSYDVTFALKAIDDTTTTVHIAHEVPESERQTMEDYWHQDYFAPMKQLLEGQASQRVRLRLINKQLVTGNVWSFRFAPTRPLTWRGGQYIWVELLHDHPGAEGTRRWFTISSAPYEEIVQITTRITDSSFKQALQVLPIDGELELLEKPDGDFVWQNSALPLVFVAGGIGITAFHSILSQRVHDQLPLAATLVYANRDTDIPFRAELENWAAADPRLKIHLVTGVSLNWGGLRQMEPQLNQSLVYISGPEAMVKAIGDELISHGLPQSQLRLDALPHYSQHNF